MLRHPASTPARHRALSSTLPLLSLLLLTVTTEGAAQEEPRLDQGALRQESKPAEPARELVAGGEVIVHPFAPGERDDAVPLPRAAERVAGGAGDQVVSAATGDPFFLGFAAGEYRPPVDERVDPLLVQRLQNLPLDGAQETYAFVMFQKRITDERVAALESLGVRVLGVHPHYSLRVALPATALSALSDLDFVRWVGTARAWQKVHPLLASALASTPGEQQLDVVVSLFEPDDASLATFEYVGTAEEVTPENAVPGSLPEDMRAKRWRSNGPRQLLLEQLGMEVTSYDESIAAFRGRVRTSELATIRDLDCVQFVELDIVPSLLHDESMPFINADKTRVADSGGTNKAAVLGQVDSGIESSHFALNHVYGWGWDLAGTAGGPWDDVYGHGSHVAGTEFADPPAGYEELTGVAPGLGSEEDLRIFNVKVFNDAGTWGSGTTMQDIFDRMHSSVTYNGVTTPKPHVVNNSWGTKWNGTPFIGSEADARLLDNEVFLQNQLYVFASGNEGPTAGSLRLQAAAKNSLTVGNVVPYEWSGGNPGTINSSSSRGPAADGRWKPNVCAPGTSIESVDSGTTNGYTAKTGTSMAAPHVSGLAAALVDHYSFLRYRPEVTGAVLMASAMTKGNQAISTPSDSHLDNYGTGRIDAWKALHFDSQQATYFWGFSQGDSGWSEMPFTVQAGATRMTVVMNYYEQATSAGSSKALVNDLDLWLDAEPFASGGASGDYYAQQSSLDNTEIRILNNPQVGNWKAKVFPQSTPGSMNPDVGVCVIISYGDTTPDGVFTLSTDRSYAKPNQIFNISSGVYNPSYIADGVYLDSSSTSGASFTKSEVTLKDGAVASLLNNPSGGQDVLLGDIVHGDTRSVAWGVRWASEGNKTFSVNLESDNMLAETKSLSLVVDGTAPGTPGNVHSTTHSVNGHSCNTTVSMAWNAASDNLSGVKGYALAWTQVSNSDPGTTIDTSGTSYSANLAASSSPWYFHIRAIDNALNSGNIVHVGPFYVNTASSSVYCQSNPNSTGNVAVLETTGAICLATKQLTLHAYDMPHNQFGHFMMSKTQAYVPFFGGSQGNLCLGGTIYRFSQHILNTGNSGAVSFPVPFNNLPQGITIHFGESWNFQFWVRDVGQKSNTTNGLNIQFD